MNLKTGALTMKTFHHIASLVKSKREKEKNFSQEELASLMGYKSNYLIANIEEALCSVPLKSMSKLCSLLEIKPEDFKKAVLLDHKESLDRYFSKKVSKKVVYH